MAALQKLSVEVVECLNRHFLIEIENQQGQRWNIIRRYSDFRRFRNQICELVQDKKKCPERCHFLCGMQLDKFPRRKLIHSKSVLAARMEALRYFLQAIAVRISLCNENILNECAWDNCSILRCIADFLDVPFESDITEDERA